MFKHSFVLVLKIEISLSSISKSSVADIAIMMKPYSVQFMDRGTGSSFFI